MFGGIPGSILLDILKQNGHMYQLSLPLTPPEYTIPEEYFTSVPIGYECVEEYTGNTIKTSNSVNHPGFENIRSLLEKKGFIDVQRSWVNGDVVLKTFRLNGHWFYPGDQFSSPEPCLYTIKKSRS